MHLLKAYPLENFALCRLAFLPLILSILVFAPPSYPQAASSAASTGSASIAGEGDPTARRAPSCRVEKVSFGGGAEIVTLFGRPKPNAGSQDGAEIPLVSVLRDTLGDEIRENDRFRYIWMLTYAKPSWGQKAAAFVPFLYTRTTNNTDAVHGPPPPIADMSPSGKGPWRSIASFVFRKVILGEFGTWTRASVLQYRQNKADYRRSAIARSLAVLSMCRSDDREVVLSEPDLEDIQARLWLTDKSFGSHMQSENLPRVYDKELAKTRDIRSQNWELLRQYTEAQGLYFDPLPMPDGTVRHAIVWAAAEDLDANKNRKFDGRFLNIKNPWNGAKLSSWKGYSEIRWFDGENRIVAPGTPDAVRRTMIPLALYGLDFPKIPVILVDFRDNSNAKMREMSGRIVHDITSNVLSFGPLPSLRFLFGRFVYNYMTRKPGMDVNQTTRLRSYSQLKLLLSLDSSLDKTFKDLIGKRLEHVTLNPLENDPETEMRLARSQYENLIDYARRPDGLAAQLDRERREEMVELNHSRKERTLYSAAHFFSFGLFTKRENATPELVAKISIRRQLDHHERYLREVAFKSVKPEVDSDVSELKRSLLFVAENGAAAREKTAKTLARIFMITADDETRALCLTGLYRIDNSAAKKELLAIYGDQKVVEQWRDASAHYLKLALKEGQQISARDARAIAAIRGD